MNNELIKKIVEGSDSDYLIPIKISLALNGNKIRPFKDEQYSDVVLTNLGELNNLNTIQRKRFLMLIDGGDRQIQAWLENLSGKHISEWYDFINDFYKDDIKKTKENLWNYFSIIFLPQSNLPSVMLYEMLKQLKASGKYLMMNKIIDKYSANLGYTSNRNEIIINLYSMLRKNHMEGLGHTFDHYMGILGRAYYDSGNFLDADDYFELTLKLNPNYANSVDFLTCSYDTKMKSGDFAEAEKLADSLTKVLPDVCWSYFKKAEALYFQNKFKDAIPYYTFAIEKEEHKEFYRKRADCYTRTAPKVKGVIRADYTEKINFDNLRYGVLEN